MRRSEELEESPFRLATLLRYHRTRRVPRLRQPPFRLLQGGLVD